MIFDVIFGTVVYLDPIYVKFTDQGHRLKFKVTGENCSFSAESENELGKTIPAK